MKSLLMCAAMALLATPAYAVGADLSVSATDATFWDFGYHEGCS